MVHGYVKNIKGFNLLNAIFVVWSALAWDIAAWKLSLVRE